MLVSGIAEQFVFDKRTTKSSSRSVAVQLRDFLVGGDVRVLIVEIGSGIQCVGATVTIEAAMKGVGACSCAQIDVCAAGPTLLRIVHRSVYTKLLNGFRSRGGQCLPNRQIRRRRALQNFGSSAGSTGDAGVVHNTRRRHAARALAVE